MSGSCPNRLPIHKSEHILGKLYRSVDCKALFKKCIEGDHDRSVSMNYSMNWYILGDERKLKQE